MGVLSAKPPSAGRRQGLRKLSPDLISKARDETASQVTRIGLTFVGTAAFCLLSLLTPDSALLGGIEKINVPLAGPVSFFGFMLLGPALLIGLRVYLQIYVEHSERLDRLARSVSAVRAPTLLPLQNLLIRLLSNLTHYLLLPVTLLLFAWKAAAFPVWGSGLLVVAVAAIASHLMLPFGRLSWRSKALLSVSAALVAAGIMLGSGWRLHRPFDLFRANLSEQRLAGEELRNANLERANLRIANLSDARLTSANLRNANLSGAYMRNANLSSADLTDADLSSADLTFANLSSANLFGANLTSANLFGTDLSSADLLRSNLSGANMRDANMRSADVTRADLSGANLSFAKMFGARLGGANLSSADLRFAKLSSADLNGANLSHAKLNSADLSDADLSDAAVTQSQLDVACGNSATKLPAGLTVKPCSKD